MNTVSFKQEQFSLRAVRLDDLPAMESALLHPDFPLNLPLSHLAQSGRLAGWLLRVLEQMAAGKAWVWTIDEADQRCVGQISLFAQPAAQRLVLAYWLHPDCWGRGVLAHCLPLVLQHVFDHQPAIQIWAGVSVWNTASVRVLQRLGFIEGAADPAGFMLAGEPQACRTFSLSAAQWRERGVQP